LKIANSGELIRENEEVLVSILGLVDIEYKYTILLNKKYPKVNTLG